ncbi:hypothetical protein TCON_2611 [Astathelohania contejeani]|uniref:Nudix hydrolase domain-containing protein n=1 Tax=Astathelohania contejeani TaxID=164912 RepID=A0ABQ7HVI3_9MICR|nr:hypothetical protein TCON_2611 [Thelohania contejeani]
MKSLPLPPTITVPVLNNQNITDITAIKTTTSIDDKPRSSLGLIYVDASQCFSTDKKTILKDCKILMLHSPSYFYNAVLNKNYRRKWKDKKTKVLIFENISSITEAEYVNLYQHMFGNGNTFEGEYTLPRGQPEKIDQKIPIVTQIREFMEETHCTHSDFISIINTVKGNKKTYNYILPTITEKWIGLNGKTYQCDYSILVEATNENHLIPFNHSRSKCLNWLLENLGDITNSSDTPNNAIKRYSCRFPYSHRLDEEKTAYFISLGEALIHINNHRLKTLIPLDTQKLIYTIVKKINESRFYYDDIYPSNHHYESTTSASISTPAKCDRIENSQPLT